MRTHLQKLGAFFAFSAALTALATAQEKPAAGAREREIVPLKVQVVISRYQGEKRVSNMPFMLSVNANEGRSSNLRMGAQIPIPATTFAPAVDGKQAPITSYQYKDVGTSIDCSAATTEDGRIRLNLTVEDSSVIGEEAGGQAALVKGASSFRSFRATETLLLKDGQSSQFTTATDKVTGDVIKADVTVNIVK